MNRRLVPFLLALTLGFGPLALPAMADDDDDDAAPAATGEAVDPERVRSTRLPVITLGDGGENEFALSPQSLTMPAGKPVILTIAAKGFKEYRFEAPEFFAKSVIGQVAINDKEVHTDRLIAVEFDDTGEIEIFMTAPPAGTYPFAIKGFESRGMTGSFVVE